MEDGKDDPSQDGSQQPRLVDMTVTEDNPIIIRRQTQQSELVPVEQTRDVTEMMMSQFQESVLGAVMPTNPSQQMILHSGETPAASQVIPVDISGGKFDAAHIGPKNMTATKNVGFAGGDFRGAHFGPALYMGWPGEESERKRKNPDFGDSSSSHQDAKVPKYVGGKQLSDSIWFFEDRPLARKAKIFEGVKTNKITDDEPLAIKLIWQYLDKNKREVKNLTKLRPHTHVVTILHADEYKEAPVKCLYIAMERCSTLNLDDYIKDRRSKNVPFNVKQAFEHAKQVIDAINHIHEQNIMHRDLKPTSVLFSLCGRYLKICDFGLSKELEHGRSVTGLSTLKVGTDGYRAPETYNMGSISKLADVFSLALVLHHLLSYGFHPFGIDPDDWNSNIKKSKCLDLKRLRVPFFKIAKELLEKMLKFEPKDRPKMDQVKNSEFMKLDWFPSIIESLVPIWNGTILDHAGADMLTCQLYRSPSFQDIIEIDGSDWKFQMNTFPYLDIGSLKKVADEEPSGYIVTSSKDELKKLVDKLTTNNLMGWIDISKDGKDPKVIVLLFQPGYPELFGLFLPDANILTSHIEKLAPMQRPTSQKPAPGYPELFGSFLPDANILTSHIEKLAPMQRPTSQKPAPASFENLVPTTALKTLKEPTNQDPTKDQEAESADRIARHDLAKEQEAVSAAKQQKQTSPDLIPWWIFTRDLQN